MNSRGTLLAVWMALAFSAIVIEGCNSNSKEPGTARVLATACDLCDLGDGPLTDEEPEHPTSPTEG